MSQGLRTFVQPGIRAHAMKFNVDAAARRRLKAVLQTLDEHDEAVRLALETGDTATPGGPADCTPQYALARMRTALETLVYGPNGEFR